MITRLQNILQPYKVGDDGIYGRLVASSSGQSEEVAHRECVAAESYAINYLDAVIFNHSIPVMDHEIDRFLAKMRPSALILDIGGCWGWHWRRLAQTRPDVGVLIIDLVRSNLVHAQNLLGDLVGHQVALMHADATELPFFINASFPGFDGVWTVQAFQHIPSFNKAVSEVRRVLKRGGLFANYSLNNQLHIRWLYRLFGRDYISEGMVDNTFWLARVSREQKRIVETVFGNTVFERWSEILFSPELHFIRPGREGCLLGKLDVLLSNNWGFLGWFARQRSFHCEKI